MKIEFRLTLQDYQEMNQARLKSKRTIYYLFLFSAILFILLGIFFLFDNDIITGILILFLGIILSPEPNLFQKFLIKLNWKERKDILRQPIEIEATEDYFGIKGELFETRMKWHLFSKFIESENLFILWQEKVLLRVVPKRAFVHEEELQEFRKLLETKIRERNS